MNSIIKDWIGLYFIINGISEEQLNLMNEYKNILLNGNIDFQFNYSNNKTECYFKKNINDVNEIDCSAIQLLSIIESILLRLNCHQKNFDWYFNIQKEPKMNNKIAKRFVSSFDFNFFKFNKDNNKKQELIDMMMELLPSFFDKKIQLQQQVITMLNFKYKGKGTFYYCSKNDYQKINNYIKCNEMNGQNYNIIYDSKNNIKLYLDNVQEDYTQDSIIHNISFYSIKDAVNKVYGKNIEQFLKDIGLLSK